MTLLCNYDNNAHLRASLYSGDIYLLSATEESLELAQCARQCLINTFGEDYRNHDHYAKDKEAFFYKIKKIRSEIYLGPKYHKLLISILRAHDFDVTQVKFDPARLRVVSHKGHANENAKAVFYPHRDTWYGNSQSLVTWWIPLDDLSEEETFVFYPDYYAKSVSNDSEIFDYTDWTKDGTDLKVGWQNINDGKTAEYPQLTQEIDKTNILPFSCKRGQNLLFSGAHLHETLKQETGRTRFSLDFRVVYLPDIAKQQGAPNVDNRSRGDSVVDYYSGAQS